MPKGIAKITIAGGTGQANIVATGEIMGIGIRHNGAPAGTLTVVIAHAFGLEEPVLTNVVSVNRIWSPRKEGQSPSGADSGNQFVVPYYADGQVRISFAGATNGQVIDVGVFWR